ncbi:hypothetical protein ACFQL4_08540 [Halosimplex aquaticum]
MINEGARLLTGVSNGEQKPMSQDARGVSNVLGIVLLFAVVIAGTALVLSVGAAALDDTSNGSTSAGPRRR